MYGAVIKKEKFIERLFKQQQTDRLVQLQKRLVLFAFFNFFLVSLLGVWLRSFSFIPASLFTYKNVLHGHSHFAFGGWLMPILLTLLLHNFPVLTQNVAYKHWRNIALMLLVSAYGMLPSFPLQGYGFVSIIFSTLAVAASFYFAFVAWRAIINIPATTSLLFLKWSLIYLTISAIGPFATGPLIAMGKTGTPLYYDAIYYYLHFQYNGFFMFAVLAIFYQWFGKKSMTNNSRTVFLSLNTACAPTFFLSILWHQPSYWFHFIGGVAALLQLAALVYLWRDARHFISNNYWIKCLLTLSFMALTLKLVLQLLSALPPIALLAYQYRNFTIAYLHLVLLGFISVFCFAATFHIYNIRITPAFKGGLCLFIATFIITGLLLVWAPLGSIINSTLSNYFILLISFSCFFPMALPLIFYGLRKQLQATDKTHLLYTTN